MRSPKVMHLRQLYEILKKIYFCGKKSLTTDQNGTDWGKGADKCLNQEGRAGGKGAEGD